MNSLALIAINVTAAFVGLIMFAYYAGCDPLKGNSIFLNNGLLKKNLVTHNSQLCVFFLFVKSHNCAQPLYSGFSYFGINLRDFDASLRFALLASLRSAIFSLFAA